MMDTYALMNKYIDSKRDYIVRLTRKLVDIPTVNPPGKNYEKIVDVLEEELKRIGLSTKRINTPKSILKEHKVDHSLPRINLVADWKAGAGKTAHLTGHYDVVPTTPGWRSDPFKSFVKNGRLYGRGAEDMKGTITAMILAVTAIRDSGSSPRVNIQLSFTPDEETGGMTGFGWLVKDGRINADYGISEGYADDCVSCGNKGIIWSKVTCLGRTAHASMPYKGVNSFDAMLLAGDELRRLGREISKRKTGFRTKDPRDRFSTMVLGGELAGGIKTNIIPSESSFSIDRRIIPEESLAQAKRELRSALERCRRKMPASRYKLEILAQDGAVSVGPDERICRAIGAAIRTVKKKRARFLLMAGGTDLRYLIKKGIPSVGYSARGGESWHSDDEFVYVSSILDTARIYALTLLNLP
jgi:succinyl-diaminopimelate desuccinylase